MLFNKSSYLIYMFSLTCIQQASFAMEGKNSQLTHNTSCPIVAPLCKYYAEKSKEWLDNAEVYLTGELFVQNAVPENFQWFSFKELKKINTIVINTSPEEQNTDAKLLLVLLKKEAYYKENKNGLKDLKKQINNPSHNNDIKDLPLTTVFKGSVFTNLYQRSQKQTAIVQQLSEKRKNTKDS